MAAARKPASRRSAAKPKPRARAQRSAVPAMRVPLLEQRHLDLIGLGLVALGVFLAFPVYMNWDGGAAGHAATQGLAYLVGQVGYAVPAAIVAGGVILVLRPVLPAIRPFRAGGLCLCGARPLALPAGWSGPAPPGRGGGCGHPPFFEARGGITGDALLYAVATAFSTIGAHILAVFLFVAAVLLLTGATISGVLRATISTLSDTTRALGRAVPSRPVRAPRAEEALPLPRPSPPPVPEPVVPPEPEDDEVVVRATHVEAPSLDGATRYPDLFGEPVPEQLDLDLDPDLDEPEPAAEEEPEPDRTEVLARVRRALEPSDLTPQGRLRGSVTDDPAFQWRLPSPDLLKRSSAEQTRPDTAG